MKLTPFQRRVVEAFRAGMPYDEIAQRARTTPEAAKVTICALRKRGLDLPIRSKTRQKQQQRAKPQPESARPVEPLQWERVTRASVARGDALFAQALAQGR